MNRESFLTTEEVATILRVHPKTVLKYLRLGKLEGIKLGKAWRIPIKALENLGAGESQDSKTSQG